MYCYMNISIINSFSMHVGRLVPLGVGGPRLLGNLHAADVVIEIVAFVNSFKVLYHIAPLIESMSTFRHWAHVRLLIYMQSQMRIKLG